MTTHLERHETRERHATWVHFEVTKRIGCLVARAKGQAVLRVAVEDELQVGEAVLVANTLVHGEACDVVFVCEGRGARFRREVQAIWHGEVYRWTRIGVEQMYLYGTFYYLRERVEIVEDQRVLADAIPNRGYYDDVTARLVVDRGWLHQARRSEIEALDVGDSGLAHLVEQGVAVTRDPAYAPRRRRG